MSTSLFATVVLFLVALIISTIIIYVITKLFEEKEGFETALPAALIGAVIYAVAYYLMGDGLLAAVVGGFVWLLALGALYDMSWFKALGVAFVVWIVAMVVGWFLPTMIGPL